MARVRRIIIDQEIGWLYHKDLVSDLDNPTPQGEDYLYLPSDDGSEDVDPGGGGRIDGFGVLSVPLYHTRTQAYNDPTVWGIGVISFGPPTQAQKDFAASANAATDLSLFPGDHINVDFGLADEISIGMQADFFQVQFAGGRVTLYADRIQIDGLFGGAEAAIVLAGKTIELTDQGTSVYDLRELFVVNIGSAGSLEGTDAPQTLVGSNRDDQIEAGNGAVIIRGGDGDDELRGGAGRDTIFGEAGNDLIFGGTGDSLYGDNDSDRITVDGPAFVDGGTSLDTLVVDMSLWGASYLVAPTAINGTFGPGFDVSGIEFLEVIGSDVADEIVGSNFSDKLYGGAGIDRLFGGGGSDILDAGEGLGGIGAQVMQGGGSADTARPIHLNFSDSLAEIVNAVSSDGAASVQFYRFAISGASGSIDIASTFDEIDTTITLTISKADGTVIDSFDGNATLTGLTAGEYILKVELQNTEFRPDSVSLSINATVPQYSGNQLYGGAGDDEYYVYSTLDQVFENDDKGNDIVFSAVSYVLSEFVETLRLTGSDDLTGTGNSGDNLIEGTHFGTNSLFGGDGDDILIGGGFADTLEGGEGDDELDGGAGLDTAVVSGGIANSQITVSGQIVTISGPDGTDTLRNIEQIRFAGTGQTILLDLEPDNTAPVAVNDTASARPGTPLTIAVLRNDSDADGDTLTLTEVGSPEHGEAAISGSSIIYTATAGYSGTDTFVYTVSDGNGGTDSATVTVTVSNSNRAPVLPASQSLSTIKGIDRAFTVSATDPDGDTVTYAVSGVDHGTVTTTAAGSFLYSPTAGYSGIDSFIVTASDGKGASTQQSVSVTIRSVPLADDFRVIATDGFEGQFGGSGSIFGTRALQYIRVLDEAGTFDFDTSFNRGGDVIQLRGTGFDWSIARSGSNAVLTDGDTYINLPVGPTGIVLLFDDGARTLKFDTQSQSFKIGNQAFTALADITAVSDGTPVPLGSDQGAFARVLLSTDSQVTAGGNLEVFGTAGADRVTVLLGEVSLDPSFNRGGDTVILPFDAIDFSAVRNGSQVVLTGEGIDLTIPFGRAGLDIVFAGGDERTLLVDTTQGSILLGNQEIGLDPIQLAAAIL